MTEYQDITQPTPAIVIAVGTFGVATASEVNNIYLRGDSRRKKVSFFLTLAEKENGEIGLFPLDSEALSHNVAADNQVDSALLPRQLLFQKTVNSSGTLRLSIEQALHSIRSHDLLTEAGWSEESNVPVNIFLLADLKDPISTGTILPLVCLLNDITYRSNLNKVHAILNTAVFPGNNENPNPNQDVDVYTFLSEMDDLLQTDSQKREGLAQALQCEKSMPLSTVVYLFDCHKEGSYVVRDNEQMQVMVGNAVLALMEKNMARQAAARHDPFEVSEGKCFYNSIGAVAMIYDPETLQLACAKRAAGEFIASTILSDGVDAQIALNEASMIEKETGDLRAWLEYCLYHLPPEIGQIRLDPDTSELSILLADLKLSIIDFEMFNLISWCQEIKDYDKHFDEAIKPNVISVISNNNLQMQEIIYDKLSSVIEILPVKPDLYPGGLSNAIKTLEFLTEHNEKEIKRIQELVLVLDKKLAVVNQELEKNLEIIQGIIDLAPKLPWLIRKLPKFARVWAAPVFYAYRYGKKLLRLQSLKTESINLLQTKYSIQVQKEAFDRIVEAISNLQDQIKSGAQDYTNLKEKIEAAQKQLPTDWPNFPLGQSENGWDDVFRIPVVDSYLADWGYLKWHPPFEKWTYEFLAESGPFIDWRNISSDIIVEWLSSLGTKTYAPVWQVTIDEVFGLWKENTSGFSSTNPTFQKLIANSIILTFPLLRPDFDEVGGGGLSSISVHGLIGKQTWQNFQVTTQIAENNNLDLVYTDDPYTGLFLKIRHSVPLNSLTEMVRLPKLKLSVMPNDKKQQYSFAVLQSETIGSEDQSSPDIIQKVFNWKFKPKGSSTEVKQSISLDISKTRFELYRRTPRFRGEWNRYAEEEMPEIRALALEFQKLHTAKNWSTYNQAFNVLKFVQNCIPYALDKDTIGHTEWPRYPIETIMEGTGDCEDVAILCAAIIARLGFQTVLLHYPSRLVFGVAGADKLKGDYIVEPTSGKRYFYGEATADGWHLGTIPDNFQKINPDKIFFINILIDEE